MAIQTRVAGDALPVVNVDTGTGLASIIAPGLTKAPYALKIAFVNTLGKSQAFEVADMNTGNSVETILRQIAIDSTIVMYQVDTTGMSVLVEATGAGNTAALAATALTSRIQAFGNISVGTGNVWANNTVVTSSNGFKL